MRFDPEKWHICREEDWKTCTQGVNCYSYILDNPSYYWSVSWLGFVHTQGQQYTRSFDEYFKNMSLDEFRKLLIEGAIKDGLIKSDILQDKEGYYLTALYFSKNEKDFHWYRKDDDGHWSSKDGWRAVNAISVPKEDNSLYQILGGYFLVPRKKITLNENFPLLIG